MEIGVDLEKEDQANGEQKLERRRGRRQLLKFEELPEYMKDNEYILEYYRCEWPLKDAILSVFSWHNETLNIWTHIAGFFVFVMVTAMSSVKKTTSVGWLGHMYRAAAVPTKSALTMIENMNLTGNVVDYHPHSRGIQHTTSLNSQDPNGNNIPRWPWLVLLAGAMCCFIFSSLSHLLASHSRKFYHFFWRLDYAGITLMIVCSFFAPIYYAFSCHPHVRLLYLITISVVGVIAVITLLLPAQFSPQFRLFRVCLFVTMGLSAIVPTIHAIILYREHARIFVAVRYELIMAGFYISGAWFYASRIPEKWKPGAFDIAGHSHQIFHVLVVAGALANCALTLVLMDFRQKTSCSFTT